MRRFRDVFPGDPQGISDGPATRVPGLSTVCFWGDPQSVSGACATKLRCVYRQFSGLHVTGFQVVVASDLRGEG